MTPPAVGAQSIAGAPARRAKPSRLLGIPALAPAPARPARGSRQRTRQGPLAELIGAILALPDNRLLDRLIRGRLWIGLVAFALIGIVAMQLVVLRLNTGIGTALARESALQRENATISIENSTAAAGEAIEPQAERRGMHFASAGAIHFLTAHAGDVARAAAWLRAAPTVSGQTSPQSIPTATAPQTAEQSETAAAEQDAPQTGGAVEESSESSEAATNSTSEPSSSSASPTPETSGESAPQSERSPTNSAAVAASGGTEPTG